MSESASEWDRQLGNKVTSLTTLLASDWSASLHQSNCFLKKTQKLSPLHKSGRVSVSEQVSGELEEFTTTGTSTVVVAHMRETYFACATAGCVAIGGWGSRGGWGGAVSEVCMEGKTRAFCRGRGGVVTKGSGRSSQVFNLLANLPVCPPTRVCPRSWHPTFARTDLDWTRFASFGTHGSGAERQEKHAEQKRKIKSTDYEKQAA